MRPQADLEQIVVGKGGWDTRYYKERNPTWRCPRCKWLNVYANTFGEICANCSQDHTLDWEDYIQKIP